MAIVKVTMLAGRSGKVKDRIVEGITEVMTREVDPDPSHITVMIEEVDAGNYAVRGRRLIHVLKDWPPKEQREE